MPRVRLALLIASTGCATVDDDELVTATRTTGSSSKLDAPAALIASLDSHLDGDELSTRCQILDRMAPPSMATSSSRPHAQRSGRRTFTRVTLVDVRARAIRCVQRR